MKRATRLLLNAPCDTNRLTVELFTSGSFMRKLGTIVRCWLVRKFIQENQRWGSISWRLIQRGILKTRPEFMKSKRTGSTTSRTRFNAPTSYPDQGNQEQQESKKYCVMRHSLAYKLKSSTCVSSMLYQKITNAKFKTVRRSSTVLPRPSFIWRRIIPLLNMIPSLEWLVIIPEPVASTITEWIRWLR